MTLPTTLPTILEALRNAGATARSSLRLFSRGTVPTLPRPLKRWEARWLVREILAVREQRLIGSQTA
jgi:hypothetical protein